MFVSSQKKYLLLSIVFHVLILTVFIVSLDFSSPLAVVENTNKQDVISAVVLGDVPQSKVLPNEIAEVQPPIPSIKKEEPKPKADPEPEKIKTKADVIPLQAKPKKVQKIQPLFGKDLLADIKKVNEKQKRLNQKKLQAAFQKTLRESAEQSLRQQLLDEEIKLRGTQSRQSQGEINKYKALIMQAISEHWVIPREMDKKRYCELMIRVAPGGTVLDVQVIKPSGDSALDTSARIAVLKASPLPVPKDADAFLPFRQFILKAKPENILSNDMI